MHGKDRGSSFMPTHRERLHIKQKPEVNDFVNVPSLTGLIALQKRNKAFAVTYENFLA